MNFAQILVGLLALASASHNPRGRKITDDGSRRRFAGSDVPAWIEDELLSFDPDRLCTQETLIAARMAIVADVAFSFDFTNGLVHTFNEGDVAIMSLRDRANYIIAACREGKKNHNEL